MTMLNIDRDGQIAELHQRAYNIRQDALRMGQVQGQGYVGQALGAADLLAVAYFHAMKYQPESPEWEGRDRFYLSIGHYAIALYAALIEAKIVPLDERKAMEPMTAVYQCQAWPLIRPVWKLPVARSDTVWALQWVLAWHSSKKI